MTIEEIAREAGVSKSTVSRVLNGKPDVLPETRNLVMEIVEKYNYQPNAWAKGMIQKSLQHIGLVIPHEVDYIFKNPYYDEILRGVLNAAQERGYYVLVMCCRNLKEAIDAVMQKRIDGLVFLSPTEAHKTTLEKFQELEMPFVTIGRTHFVPSAYQVCTDNYRGSVKAMEHLYEMGHRNIAFINGPFFLPSSNERYQAYKDSMDRFGLAVKPAMVVEGNNSIDSGSSSINKILDELPEVTAVFVASDYMAIGVLEAIRRRGLRTPEDISVIGFDNIPLGQYIFPKLSTVDQQISQKGYIATQVLLDLVTGNEPADLKSNIIDIEIRFLRRDSSGPVPV